MHGDVGNTVKHVPRGHQNESYDSFIQIMNG